MAAAAAAPPALEKAQLEHLERCNAPAVMEKVLAFACKAAISDLGVAMSAIANDASLAAHRAAPPAPLATSAKDEAWQALQLLSVKQPRMDAQFRVDSRRVDKLSVKLDLGADATSGETNFVYFDYSKNLVNEEVMAALGKLMNDRNVKDTIEEMFSGSKINATEERAVLHVALRGAADAKFEVDGEDVMPKIREVQSKMKSFTDAVRSGAWKGHTGAAIKEVVSIGIGGSHLGPAMVCQALSAYAPKDSRVHFVSNVDAAHIQEVLKSVNLDQTLFVVTSKTFTTTETLTNAEAAKAALVKHFGGDTSAVSKHFVAVTTNVDAAIAFGIDQANTFTMWDWVGGRFSLWSAVGLPIALYLGYGAFEELLAGAREMDNHFRATSDWSRNIPAVMAMLQVWYNNFMGAAAFAVVPYAARLQQLPAFLQQLEMESNGKLAAGSKVVDVHTSPVLMGAPGTDAQHSFFQLLHQGTKLVPVDFVTAFKASTSEEAGQQTALITNMIAQMEALLVGRDATAVDVELAAKNMQHSTEAIVPRIIPGNKPSTAIIMKQLTPRSLGALLAAYEDKTLVVGAIYGINSFDQFGVELGKTLASKLLKELGKDKPAGTGHDGSTNALITLFNETQ